MILVASTVAAWKCQDGTETKWLSAMASEAHGRPLEVFCAVEGPDSNNPRFDRLNDALARVWRNGTPITVWRFDIDDGEEQVNSGNRLHRICTGRNLAIEYATRIGAEWILYLDTDTEPPDDAIGRLLEVGWPLVGGEVPSYCLTGQEAVARRIPVPRGDERFPVHPHVVRGDPYGFPVEERWMNTAGFMLVHRSIFRRLRWRWDPDAGMTDDPCFCRDSADHLGYPILVRTDVVGRHHPERLAPVEQRGVDLTIHADR